ncbi:MAG TPA: hypothetical protein VM100_01005, partial [Longimicrobiales bacterium]|nr:hypothetical protein [Longimicrobiales bacterium]
PNAPSGVATRARHLVLGLEREAPVFLRVEAFMKSYSGYTNATGSAVPQIVQQGPAIDQGRALGVDALIRWKASGALSGWASYSYLDAEVKLASSQASKLASSWIPSATDVHHTFTGVAKLAVSDNWEIGTTARLGSGKPYTPHNAAVHSDRMPTYARLDTRLTRLMTTKGGMVVVYVEGLNLLDRHNVMGYTYDSSFSRKIPVESFFAHRTLVIGAEAMF